MKYELAIFDLDGTILDTLDDLTDAVNIALDEAGFPRRSRDEVRRFIGNGVVNLIRRAVPEHAPQAVQEAILRRFRAIYTEHINDRTAPFEGMPQLVLALRGAGIRVAVNSNKPDAATKLLCAAHYGDAVELALGERPDIPKKPAPDGALHIMRALNVPASRTLYVGDGDADIRTAENAGIDCAWVSWGYRRREELDGLAIPHAFDSPRALMKFILE